ncbi:hypothetical protein CCO03_05575 [Comamonas serinivorans]|uniref:Uncharacterized protein n=1 Tax=Comamonas serinivorans TaxID=1082851 RepID=A0A1Y0EKW6_9BURK|nr:hypothetical protein CCO03_05575 [Comamonas serinivorans]
MAWLACTVVWLASLPADAVEPTRADPPINVTPAAELRAADARRQRAMPAPAALATHPLADTRWHHQDDDGDTQVLHFAPQGRLTTSNPNDITPDNDRWSADAQGVVFSFNDGYARYEGRLQGHDRLTGTALNRQGRRWSWSATRLAAPSAAAVLAPSTDPAPVPKPVPAPGATPAPAR